MIVDLSCDLGDAEMFQIVIEHYPHYITMHDHLRSSWENLNEMVHWAQRKYGDDALLSGQLSGQLHMEIDLDIPWIWGAFDPNKHGIIAFQKLEDAVECKIVKG